MDLKKIRELVEIVEESSMLEFSIKDGDTKIHMSRRGEVGQAGEVMTVATNIGVTSSEAAEIEADEDAYINAPIVGTFYSAPAPEAKAFVAVGDVVKDGDTICILEAMKLMNEIEADFDCEIEAILVSNEQKVEYGQPLFRVKAR